MKWKIIIVIRFQEFVGTIIYSAFHLIANYLLFALSKINEKNYQNPKILRTIAIINIIFIIIDVCLVPVMIAGPPSDTRYFVNDVYYIIIRSFFGLVPYLITFGVLLFIFGKRNQEQFGKYLKISGILAGIGYGISILAYLFISISIFVYNPSDILRSLVIPFNYIGFGLLITILELNNVRT